MLVIRRLFVKRVMPMLFGRHAAGVMRWPRGHGVGVGHHPPWSHAGADAECRHGRYGVGVGSCLPCISEGRRSDGPITGAGVLFSARTAGSVADGRVETMELAADYAAAGWPRHGRQSESAERAYSAEYSRQDPTGGWSCG